MKRLPCILLEATWLLVWVSRLFLHCRSLYTKFHAWYYIFEWLLYRRWKKSRRIAWRSIWKTAEQSIDRRGRWEMQETTLVSSQLLLTTSYSREIFAHYWKIWSSTICKSLLTPLVEINFILFWSNIYAVDSPDDSEDSLCIPSTRVGNMWRLWKWEVQVVLRVCIQCKYV